MRKKNLFGWLCSVNQ